MTPKEFAEFMAEFSPEEFDEWVALDIVEGEERALIAQEALAWLLAAQGVKDIDADRLQYLGRLPLKDHRHWLASAIS